MSIMGNVSSGSSAHASSSARELTSRKISGASTEVSATVLGSTSCSKGSSAGMENTSVAKVSDQTVEEFQTLFKSLTEVSKVFETRLSEEKSRSENPWLRDGVAVLSTVAEVGGAVLPFLQEFPGLTATTYNTLVIGGVAASVLWLGALGYQLARRSLGSSIAETKVAVEETLKYLGDRMGKLEERMAKIDASVGPLRQLAAVAEEGAPDDRTRLKKLLLELSENVRLCRLDIRECLGKLNQLKPKINKCIKVLNISLIATSTCSGILGAIGVGAAFVPIGGWLVAGGLLVPAGGLGAFAADRAKLKNTFTEHRAKYESIYWNIDQMKVRLDNHVQTLKDDDIGKDQMWDIKS